VRGSASSRRKGRQPSARRARKERQFLPRREKKKRGRSPPTYLRSRGEGRPRVVDEKVDRGPLKKEKKVKSIPAVKANSIFLRKVLTTLGGKDGKEQIVGAAGAPSRTLGAPREEGGSRSYPIRIWKECGPVKREREKNLTGSFF